MITIWECEMKDMDSVVKSVVDVLERMDAKVELEQKDSSDASS